MPSFQVAHIREQGQDIVIMPLDRDFEWKMQREQQAAHTELQIRVRAAGLAGCVALVWDGGHGRMSFLAPQNWHPFLRSISLAFVAQNINRTLSW